MRPRLPRRSWLVLAAGLTATLPALAGAAPALARATMALPVAATPARNGAPVVRAPARALARLLAAAHPRPKAQQIGVGVTLDKGLSDGAWSVSAAGTQAVWRLELTSSGAQALALTLTGLALPAGASLTWASGDGRVVQGPYTAKDVTGDGVLDTPMVPGAAGVLQLTMPTLDTAGAALTVHTLQHVYANVPRTEGDTTVAAKDASGACEIDVACPTGDNWRNEIRATVLYTIRNTANTGLFACSGAFLNNTNNSEDPLLYTANHCTSGNVPSSVVVYYNFQKAACGGAAMSTTGWSQTQTGASLLTSGTSADYALLRLTAAISSARNVYFNAWNASTSATATSGVDIHHPSADVKKISTYSNATRTAVNFNGATDQVWGVNWTAGTTEEGSSGSNLLNQDRQVIGTLSGGAGACSTTTPTQNNGLTDYFGRLDTAYAESATMRTALDPVGSGTATAGCAKTQGVAGCVTGTNSSSGTTSSGTGTTTSSSGTTTTTGTGTTTTSSSGGGGGALGEGLLAGLLALGVARRRGRRAGVAPAARRQG